MGMTTQNTQCAPKTRIRVHEGSSEYITHMQTGRKLSLAQFARGEPVTVERVLETGELIFRNQSGTRFACGVPDGVELVL